MTGKKQKVLLALLANANQREAARAAGVCERTIYKFLRDPEFRSEYDKACKTLVTDATRALQKSLNEAIDVMKTIMRDTDENGSVRLSAAAKLIDSGMRYTECADILTKIDELEARQNERDKH